MITTTVKRGIKILRPGGLPARCKNKKPKQKNKQTLHRLGEGVLSRFTFRISGSKHAILPSYSSIRGSCQWRRLGTRWGCSVSRILVALDSIPACVWFFSFPPDRFDRACVDCYRAECYRALPGPENCRQAPIPDSEPREQHRTGQGGADWTDAWESKHNVLIRLDVVDVLLAKHAG